MIMTVFLMLIFQENDGCLRALASAWMESVKGKEFYCG